jgi:hypothetical protein
VRSQSAWSGVAGRLDSQTFSTLVVGPLAVLSIWAIGYELSCTAVPGLLKTAPFTGIAPDIPFYLAGLLIIGRGISGERGWILVGLGALCWASGDIYWQLNLSNLSSPPVPSWADAGYLSYCPMSSAR